MTFIRQSLECLSIYYLDQFKQFGKNGFLKQLAESYVLSIETDCWIQTSFNPLIEYAGDVLHHSSIEKTWE